MVIGAVAGSIACFGCRLLKRLKVDDPVGCVPVHFFCGVWSLIAVAPFTEKDLVKQTRIDELVLTESRWKLLGVQIAVALSCSAWAMSTTLFFFIVINKVTPVRMSEEEEIQGADLVEHGIQESLVTSTFGTVRRPSTYTMENSSDKSTEYLKPYRRRSSLANRNHGIPEKGVLCSLLDAKELEIIRKYSEDLITICPQDITSNPQFLEAIEDNYEERHNSKDHAKPAVEDSKL